MPLLVDSWRKNSRDEESVRLMLQSLTEYGFTDTVKCLQSESGLMLESASVSEFKTAILSGHWADAETILGSLSIDPENLAQKYLELLEQGDTKNALYVLRFELATLHVNHDQLHLLSSFMMHHSMETIIKKIAWDGSKGESRHGLLFQLQSYVAAETMIPRGRLNTLLDQSICFQKQACLYHNSDDPVSLYTDHIQDSKRLPTTTTRILSEHADEVWFLAFSPDGNYLASASKDSHCIVWDVNSLKPLHDFQDHAEAISFLSWSPNSTMLLTASNDHTLKLWDISSGKCIHTFVKHVEPVTSCAWLPDNERFVSGSLEKNVYLWHIRGELLYKWSGVRIMDLAVSTDGNTLIAASEKKIRLYDLSTKQEIASLSESDSITSVYVAEDGIHLLINLSIQEIHLWNLKERRLIRKYVGQKQGRFVIRSCFGGAKENFVLSGSEDSRVYIWHRELGTLVESLDGHSGCCNCVAWNPTRTMFASASDDNTIRIWEPELVD